MSKYEYKYRIFKSRSLRLGLTIGIILFLFIYLHFFRIDLGHIYVYIGDTRIPGGYAILLFLVIRYMLILLFPKYMEERLRYQINRFNLIRNFFLRRKKSNKL